MNRRACDEWSALPAALLTSLPVPWLATGRLECGRRLAFTTSRAAYAAQVVTTMTGTEWAGVSLSAQEHRLTPRGLSRWVSRLKPPPRPQIRLRDFLAGIPPHACGELVWTAGRVARAVGWTLESVVCVPRASVTVGR